MRRKVTEVYFDWLVSRVDKGFNTKSYSMLLRKLHMIDFYWTIPMDANRASDGLQLRSVFGMEYGIEGFDNLEMKCSVLEMMVALSDRIERDIFNHIGADVWFWKMISNLGLMEQTNSNFDENFVSSVVRDFLDREYRSNGRGSIFVLKDSRKDARKMELWMQMQTYLCENY